MSQSLARAFHSTSHMIMNGRLNSFVIPGLEVYLKPSRYTIWFPAEYAEGIFYVALHSLGYVALANLLHPIAPIVCIANYSVHRILSFKHYIY